MKSKHRFLFAGACAIGIGVCHCAHADPTLNILASNIPFPSNTFDPSTEKVAIDGMGNLYGVTYGNIFELSGPTHQNLTTISIHQSNYGVSTLVADSAGNLYATSQFGGGPSNNGAVIEVSGANHQTVTALVTFNNSSGQEPNAITLVNGILYGTTETSAGGGGCFFMLSGPGYQNLASIGIRQSAGGVALDASGNVFGPATDIAYPGAIYKVPASFVIYQSETALFTFNASTGTGIQPGLTVDAADNVYGVLTKAGAANDGVVFELSGPNDQTFTTLATFNGSNGSSPNGGMLLDANGNLFGETQTGGLYNQGIIYELSGPNHQTFTTILNYQNSDGSVLVGNLTADSAGSLYGVAAKGFDNGVDGGFGDVFEITGSGFAVPEPSSLSLLAVGGVALLGRRRGKPLREGRGAATVHLSLPL